MGIRQDLHKMSRNSIQLTIEGNVIQKPGMTRFGGKPDVPADFQWPFFQTDTYNDDEVKPRPLSFLAQFNCEELALLDSEGDMPKTGLLSFFYEAESQRWGYDPKDEGCARVYWFDTQSLSPAEFPEELKEYCRFPSIGINARAVVSFPGWEDFSLGRGDEFYNRFEEFEEVFEELDSTVPEPSSKLLGWPDVIQNNMTCECELVRRGYYLGGDWSQIRLEDRQEAEQDSLDDWRLLFQLDTVEQDTFQLMFGDSGRVYFYIRREDLKNCRFDRAWLIQQSC